MAGCQLAFGQSTRVTNSCECMVLVQFVPVGIRHMADSIFSRSLFSLVAIKAATFATYLGHTYPQGEGAEDEEEKKQRFCIAVRILFSLPTSKFFCIVVAFRYHKFVTKFFLFLGMSFTRTSVLLHVSSREAFCFVLLFFFFFWGGGGRSPWVFL